MPRVEEREQQADRNGLGLARVYRLQQAADAVRGELAGDGSVGGDAFGNLEPESAGHKGDGVVDLQVEDAGADLSTDLEQITKALRHDQGDLTATTLDQCVGGDGRAMR